MFGNILKRLTMTKIKLSAKQKEVICKMRKGGELHKTRFIGYTSVTIGDGLLKDNFVNKNTFNSLWNNKIICISDTPMYGRMTSVYILTELGKTIDLT